MDSTTISRAKNKPLVSILINNYNYESFVADAVESALAQTYQPCEVIVVDDGSSDGSREALLRFGDRIVRVFKSNGGQASAFNAGFAHAKGDIICLLDADDLFLPEKVERVVDTLDDPQRQWYFHHLQWTDASLHPVAMPVNSYASGDRDLRADVLGFTPPATSGLAFTRALLQQILPMPENIRITSDNYLKLSAMALAPGYYSREQLTLQRVHGTNAYTGKKNLALEAEVQIATALGLRKQCPALKRIWNRMYADGLAMKFCSPARRQPSEHHFAELSLPEAVSVSVRFAYKVARRSLMQRASATA